MGIQVRFQSDSDRAAEHKRSADKTAMMPNDLVRGIGVVGGTSTGGTRDVRTTGPSSECVSYRLDENGNKVEARVFRTAPGTTAKRKVSASKSELALFRAEMLARVNEHRVTAADIPNRHNYND